MNYGNANYQAHVGITIKMASSAVISTGLIFIKIVFTKKEISRDLFFSQLFYTVF